MSCATLKCDNFVNISPMAVIILFLIYGLAFGSFVNALVYRLHSGEKIFLTQSHCVKCGKNIHWKDNVPVFSFLLLGGKCRYCDKKISWQYPIVELITSIIFGFVGYFYTINSVESLLVAVLYGFVFACLMVIFVYDLKYMEIPMTVMWIAIGLIFMANIVSDITGGGFQEGFWQSMTFINSASAVVAFCFFFGLSYVSDETWMGYGDSFLAIAIGLLLGPISTFLALMVAFCVGALVGIGLVLVSGRDMKSAVPFGPFLIFGLFVIFVVQNMYPEMLDMFI